MYNLSIEVDNQNISSGNVDVEGTDFYGCGCQASGQCGAVLGYWDDDMLVVLLSDEGCDSSEGQILSGGGIYEFEEVGSGSLNGDNSFGLSGNGVQAYATYLIHEGDDVVVSDRQSINATVRFVPVVEEEAPKDQAANLEEQEPGPAVEEEAEVLEGARGQRGDAEEEQRVVEDQDGVPIGDGAGEAEKDQGSESSNQGLVDVLGDEARDSEEVLEVGVSNPEGELEDGEGAEEEDQEASRSLEQSATLDDAEHRGEDALAAVLDPSENFDVTQVVQRDEVSAEGMLTGEMETNPLEVPGQDTTSHEGLAVEDRAEEQHEYASQEQGLAAVAVLGDEVVEEEEEQVLEVGVSNPEDDEEGGDEEEEGQETSRSLEPSATLEDDAEHSGEDAGAEDQELASFPEVALGGEEDDSDQLE